MSDQFSCNVKPVKSNRSAGSKSDYHAREGEYEPRSPDELLACESGHVPEVFDGARDMFYSADTMERKNGARGREVRFSLPCDLSDDQKIELTRDIAATLSEHLATTPGHVLPYQFAIHNSNKNPHVHLLFSERQTVPGQQYEQKQDFFKRSNPKTNAFRATSMDEKRGRLVEIRGIVADCINEHLYEAGVADTWSHLSYKDQGLDKQPGVHLGPATAHALKNGRITKRLDYVLEQHSEQADRLQAAAEIAEHSGGVVERYDVGRLEKLKAEAEDAIASIKRPEPTQKQLYSDSGYRQAHNHYKAAYTNATTKNDTAHKAEKKAKKARYEADNRPLSFKLGEQIALAAINAVRAVFGYPPIPTQAQQAAQLEQAAQQARSEADGAYKAMKTAQGDHKDAKAAVADKMYEAAKSEVTAEYRNYLAEAKGHKEGFEGMGKDVKVELDKVIKNDPNRKIAGAGAVTGIEYSERSALEGFSTGRINADNSVKDEILAEQPRSERSAGLEM